MGPYSKDNSSLGSPYLGKLPYKPDAEHLSKSSMFGVLHLFILKLHGDHTTMILHSMQVHVLACKHEVPDRCSRVMMETIHCN